ATVNGANCTFQLSATASGATRTAGLPSAACSICTVLQVIQGTGWGCVMGGVLDDQNLISIHPDCDYSCGTSG
ncbi:hypothetical protein PJI17_31670, partial [Mycobacterium kansasii]